jgi:hypothetical protein|nr:MAG TPA: hypothetical protein [Bacteriophage sp.]
MFTKKDEIISNKENLSNYIDGIDVYNSSILVYLNNPVIQRESVEITAYEYRPDLIAEAYYGSTSYAGLLMLQAARGLETYKRGAVLKLIPKKILDNILGSL